MTTYQEISRECFKRCSAPEWNLAGAAIIGGQSASGIVSPIGMPSGGLWVANFPDLSFRTAAEALAFRGLRMAANGGATPLIVPRYDVFAPWPMVAGKRQTTYDAGIHDDGSFTTDGGGGVHPVIVATAVGVVAFGSRQMVIDIDYGSDLRGSEAFSIYHTTQNWRLYEIKSVEIDDNGNFVVGFEPPLRELIADGTHIEFDAPRCLMRLQNPDSMKFSLRAFPYSPQSAAFVEHPL